MIKCSRLSPSLAWEQGYVSCTNVDKNCFENDLFMVVLALGHSQCYSFDTKHFFIGEYNYLNRSIDNLAIHLDMNLGASLDEPHTVCVCLLACQNLL